MFCLSFNGCFDNFLQKLWRRMNEYTANFEINLFWQVLWETDRYWCEKVSSSNLPLLWRKQKWESSPESPGRHVKAWTLKNKNFAIYQRSFFGNLKCPVRALVYAVSGFVYSVFRHILLPTMDTCPFDTRTNLLIEKRSINQIRNVTLDVFYTKKEKCLNGK